MAQQASFADSNIANLGSKEEKDAKLKAAQSEAEWKGAGSKIGIEVWHIEKFHVKKQPENGGTFFEGDSYIVLHTFKKDEKSAALSQDIFFWLGNATTQDEQGTAAYKTVELDDFLGGKAVQHRECEGQESEDFTALFDGHIRLLKGGVDSGFNHVTPEKYTPRLMIIHGKRHVKVKEIPLSGASLLSSDSFILDAGLQIWQWSGKNANAFEKRKGEHVIGKLKEERNGTPKSIHLDEGDDDADFWKIVGGKPASIAAGSVATGDEEKAQSDKPNLSLHKIHEAGGKITVTELSSNQQSLPRSQLTSEDVIILDTGKNVYIWVGAKATRNEKANGMKSGMHYCTQSGRKALLVCMSEGHEKPDFLKHFSK